MQQGDRKILTKKEEPKVNKITDRNFEKRETARRKAFRCRRKKRI
jgi:hypothetical protein